MASFMGELFVGLLGDWLKKKKQQKKQRVFFFPFFYLAQFHASVQSAAQ